MKKNIFFSLSAAVMLAIAGLGCSSMPDYIASHIYAPSSVLSDIAIVDLDKAMTESNVYQARVVLRNKESSDTSLRYRFVWFNNIGHEVNSANTFWRNITLGKKELRELKCMAPNDECVEFRFDIAE